jgi:hypothetical protein
MRRVESRGRFAERHPAFHPPLSPYSTYQHRRILFHDNLVGRDPPACPVLAGWGTFQPAPLCVALRYPDRAENLNPPSSPQSNALSTLPLLNLEGEGGVIKGGIEGG